MDALTAIECDDYFHRSMLADIENEIRIVHNFIHDSYRSRFPELESLVLDPIDYARVVKKIGNETDYARVVKMMENETDSTFIHVRDCLPSEMSMVVSVAAALTNGTPLPGDLLKKTMDACRRALSLDSEKKKLLHRMQSIAPTKLTGISAVGVSELATLNPSMVRSGTSLGKDRETAGAAAASSCKTA